MAGMSFSYLIELISTNIRSRKSTGLKYAIGKIIGNCFIFFSNMHWIADESGHMGISIFGMPFIYYKWPIPISILFSNENNYYPAEKREFGDFVNSEILKERWYM